MVAGIAPQEKTIGIVGGLSPETGFKFGLELNNSFLRASGCQPNLLVDNVPMPKRLERDIIHGSNTDELLGLLSDSVARLNSAGADLIAIPCNSAHIFIDELRDGSGTRILSIIEETAEECMSRRIKSVGLLASGTSVNHSLHWREFSKSGINIIRPKKAEQLQINDIIIRIIENRQTQEDKNNLLNMIGNLEALGAEAIILGCTDLQALVSQSDMDLPVIDTFTILKESAMGFLVGENRTEWR